MKKLSFLIIVMLALLSLTSCSTQSYVSDYTAFVNRTEADCHNYSLNDWKKNVSKFKKYGVTRFYKEKSNLTPAQIKTILKLDARYIGVVSAHGMLETLDLVATVKELFGPGVISAFTDEFLKGLDSE